jgi:hypothetical protein
MGIDKFLAALTLTARAIAFAGFANMASADSMTYHNGRFDVQGRLPVFFIPARPPDNGNGQAFGSANDSGQIAIYGGYNLEDSFAAYRNTLKGYYLESGAKITLNTGKGNWFVLSGFDGGRIFYLRVIEGRNCDGETVLAHWVIDYEPGDRDIYDDQIGWLSKGLKINDCK